VMDCCKYRTRNWRADYSIHEDVIRKAEEEVMESDRKVAEIIQACTDAREKKSAFRDWRTSAKDDRVAYIRVGYICQ
jgi:hypothetical protein